MSHRCYSRERSNSLGDTTEPTNQIRLHEPRPSEQVAHACEYLYDANRRDSTIVSPATRGFHIPALATTAALVNPVLKSNKKKPHSGHLPLVKLLVYGYHGDCYSAADIKVFTAVCLKCVNGLCAGNIRIYSGRGPKGEEFDWFFDPDGITPGGLLILCITGHGKPTEEGVELRTDRAGPMLMDTFSDCANTTTSTAGLMLGLASSCTSSAQASNRSVPSGELAKALSTLLEETLIKAEARGQGVCGSGMSV
ncbi:unnamed protein product [Rhizoctonia solani]|uniref:Uncharacterized protein n=1 Tax=Rhizoctonia solani TaxID=456999 RepID=A0A8H3DZN7_9AGAM|nr:unnamed protein product [Rhizoctonia solani]